MAVRGVRGATTVEADDAALIHAAARELMEEILRRNQIADFDDVISAVFTTTVDLVSAFPAEAARAIGMKRSLHLRLWMFIFMVVTFQMSCALRPLLGSATTFLPTQKKFFLQHWGEHWNVSGLGSP